MKKMLGILMAAIILTATPVFAGGNDGEIGDIIVSSANNNVNNNAANANSTSTSNATGGNANATGGNADIKINQTYAAFTTAPLTSVNLPSSSSAGTYGHLPTQFDLKLAIQVIRKIDGHNFKTIVETMKKSGSKDWNEINDEIISSPLIKNNFGQLPENEAVRFLTEIPSSGINDENVVGVIPYNSKLNKKYPVQPTDFLAKVYCDASKFGANRAIFVDQFSQAHLTSSSDGLTIGGALSWISKCLTFGQSTSASVSTAGGNSTQYNNAGTIVILYREDAMKVVEEKVVPYQPQPIERLEEVVKFCPYPCYNNASLRKQLADAQARSGNFSEAIKNYEIAQRDILAGKEPSGKKTFTMQAGLELLKVVRYNELYSILKTAGEAEEIKQAQAWGFKVRPDSVSDLKN